ncbi:peptidoglycan-binding domain-containing protein [Streptomyces aureus]|uniref:peptidoglycan-binding domain-containing protein n=1 Tax=Streptomyces aureus TaxID=193461 RepID=UPI00131D9EB1|nr:peptidoglycan-binding domain-containing protein [Streptomyces aureus]
MSVKSRIAQSMAAVVCTALVGLGGTAQASTGAPTIGDGYANNTHAVWCVQESLNYFQTHWNQQYKWGPTIPTVAQDGVWGAKTKQAVMYFQQAMNHAGPNLDVDGYVGQQTGNSIVAFGDPYYTGGATNSDAYCFQYLPTLYN